MYRYGVLLIHLYQLICNFPTYEKVIDSIGCILCRITKWTKQLLWFVVLMIYSKYFMLGDRKGVSCLVFFILLVYRGYFWILPFIVIISSSSFYFFFQSPNVCLYTFWANVCARTEYIYRLSNFYIENWPME